MRLYSPTRKRNILLPRSGAIPTVILFDGSSLSSYSSEITVEFNSESTSTRAVYGLLFAPRRSVDASWTLPSVICLYSFLQRATYLPSITSGLSCCRGYHTIVSYGNAQSPDLFGEE